MLLTHSFCGAWGSVACFDLWPCLLRGHSSSFLVCLGFWAHLTEFHEIDLELFLPPDASWKNPVDLLIQEINWGQKHIKILLLITNLVISNKLAVC